MICYDDKTTICKYSSIMDQVDRNAMLCRVEQ